MQKKIQVPLYWNLFSKMIKHLRGNPILFYLVCFPLWIVVIYAIYQDYEYFPLPKEPDKQRSSIKEEFGEKKILKGTIHELFQSLIKETRAKEKAHIFHNIGATYYELHKVIKNRKLLDTAEQYYLKSIDMIPDNARFYYNTGRLYTEAKLIKKAKFYYEKAINTNPRHILALHNLAMLNYFGLKNHKKAQTLLNQVIEIQPRSPICHYILGEIAEKEKDFPRAIHHYNREIENYAIFIRTKNEIPVSQYSLNLALLRSHLRLVVMYSIQMKDKQQTKKNLAAYLKLEKDEIQKRDVLNFYKKIWHETYPHN